ncbi:MAG TPA: tRNA uracil 4-sulfurtransferase ThiI [Streptosporangiaceae bacterium]|jgi:thiamine biosynthesis protein ThiI|nr:tRNA uracil 4-sulfurtransferase ThiI [Streptosporangiaceae bacterium]
MTAVPAPSHTSHAQAGLHEPCVLLKLGEIVLKGKNRQQFEKLLQNNIRMAAADLGVGITLWQRDGVIVLNPGPAGSPDPTPDSGSADGHAEAADRREAAQVAADKIAERMLNVMGVVRVCRAVRVTKEAAAAVETAAELAGGRPGTFAVRARRRDKRFPVTSAELAIVIGSRIQSQYGNPVNLRNPDFTIHVEVDQSEIFVYTDGLTGQGGLPVGMSGRGLVLLSGGIDSPVAAYRMMRRGLYCSFLHFSGMPLTGPESVYKAYGLVRQLDQFQRGSRLFVVPFGRAQQQLASSGSGRLQIVAQRRLMLKTAQAMARRVRADALVTGDSLGQVASQTLANITALDEAVQLPILRPLIGLDKTEIMAQARRISTLALSQLPDEDCCSLLLPRQVETRARVADLHKIEARVDVDELADELADSAQEYRTG